MYVSINRIMTVAQRLCDAGHYAAPSIRLQANKLDKDWRTFAAALDDRSTVLAMSVIFHKKAEEVRTKVHLMVYKDMEILNLFYLTKYSICFCINEALINTKNGRFNPKCRSLERLKLFQAHI